MKNKNIIQNPEIHKFLEFKLNNKMKELESNRINLIYYIRVEPSLFFKITKYIKIKIG